ncbi:MAG: hypothetical protein JO342_08950 [Solirubrobacterales bacterium]|nr:hypothetical protein [Solirubrobacterales bacterium]
MSGVAPKGRLSRHELWYGRAQEPVQRHDLRAGDLIVELEQAEIRAVRAGDIKLLSGLYMAVRDEQWGTVLGQASGLVVNRNEDHFTVDFEMTHRGPSVAFSWRGKLDGLSSGAITYEFAGVAEKAFKYSRIGFCLLHPPSECAGQPYRGRSPKGPVEGTLPVSIGPQRFERGVYWPLFPSVSELELSLASGFDLKMRFEGDLFEMEDQRNWTDASFKTYCTPQELGYPFDAQAGQQFWQKVTVEVVGTRARRTGAAAGRRADRATAHRVTLEPPDPRQLPPVGLTLPRELDEHTDEETALLAQAAPRHLRVDLDLSTPRWIERATAAGRVASSLRCQLELAAFAGEEGQLDQLVAEMKVLPVVRMLVFTRGAETSDPSMTARARALCADTKVRVPVFGGTDLWFAEVNRERPDTTAMDGLVYSITPQVHTFDEASIAESLEAQPETLNTAATFSAGLPISVSPVTLRPRDAIEADPPDQQHQASDTPFSVDPRQPSLFTAAWTVGSIASLAGAGAASITYYETVGPRGIVPGGQPLPPRELFPSPGKGGAFAVFHVFADVLELGERAMLVPCRSSSPAEVAALALRAGDLLRILIANLTAAPMEATVGPIEEGAIGVRMLDESTANEALAEPQLYRSRPAAPMSLRDGEASIDLTPFAVARLDGMPGGRP